MRKARFWMLLSLFVVICLAACSKKRSRAGATAPATAVSKSAATPAINGQQPATAVTKSPLMGAGDAAAKRNRNYPASKFNSVDSLPKNPLKSYLAKQLQSVGATGFSSIWGKTKNDFPVLAGAELLEVTDIRPWQQIYRVDTQIKAKRKKSMYVEWGFIDGHLYYLRLRFHSGAKNFAKKAAQHMKRKSDYKGKNTAGVQEWIWSQGNLQIMAAKKGRSTALQITDRGFAEVATARNAGIEAAERLVYSTTRLISPKTSDIEQMLQNNKKATKMVPSYGDAWVNICHAYYDMGQQSKALPACNKSLAVTIENSVKGEANYYLALMAAQDDDDETAIEYFDEADRLMPDSWTILKKAIKHRSAAIEGSCGKYCLQYAYFEYQCAYVVANCCGEHCGGEIDARDPGSSRYRLIPIEFGFSSMRALFKAVQKKRIDTWPIEDKVTRRCRRYTRDCPEGMQ